MKIGFVRRSLDNNEDKDKLNNSKEFLDRV